jgi:hypothetical protein
MLRRAALVILALIGLNLTPLLPVATAQAQSGSVGDTYSGNDLIDRGGAFFGSAAQGLASVVERAVSEFGLPNGYILGEEGSGAIFLGVRYGEGTLYTRNAGTMPVFWQGPSLGFDLGGDGSKVMILVYNLNTVQDVFGRFPGVDGSAYVVGGVGMTVMRMHDVVLVPIRSGVGARLGINVGYLNFTPQPTWNPF